MTFVVFAIAAIAWSLSVLRWATSIRRGRGKRAMQVLTGVVIAAGALSIASDVWAMNAARSAASSDLVVRIIRRGPWFQLDYKRGGVSFTTASELHVPAGVQLTLAWPGATDPWIDNAICVHRGDGRCGFVARSASTGMARFVTLWPPSSRTLPIVAQSPAEFERWFANEARPAAASPNASMFRNAGCAYCHVIRGVVNEPSYVAPDLTHFGSRATIASTGLPNHRAELTGWVVRSRAIDPASGMPDNAMSPDALHGLVSYLEGLR